MKDIIGYEGLYAVTSCGRVWSYRSQKFLSAGKSGSGYWMVSLYKNGERKQYLIHRLVAEAYLPNPNNLLQVNHKDCNTEHNHINNLEWCSSQYNHDYGNHNEKVAKANSIAVYCVELNKAFEGASAAARELGLNQSNITSCCKGNRKTCGGYHWRYAE